MSLTIERLGDEGDGLAMRDGQRIAVPFTLPGERVEPDGPVILEASPDRVEPVCKHFGTCGNCALQHLAYERQLEWKRGKVAAAFRRAGLNVEPEETVPVPPASRRRVTFTATDNPVRLGYHERRSSRVMPVEECPILVPGIVEALPKLERVAAIARRGSLQVLVTATQDGLDVTLLREKPLMEDERRPLIRAALEADFARLSFGDEVLAAPRPPRIRFGDLAIEPPPGAFLQATEASERAMANLVTAHVGKSARTVDLFAGCGTFALRLTGQVTAVEGDGAALAALSRAADAAGRPVTTERRDLFERPLMRDELQRFDAIVLDPPRAGARTQCEELARAEVRRVAYVSCNPATLARDAATLVEGGHRLTRLVPVDQFRFSPHVEAVALFERTPAKKSKARRRPLFG